MGARKVDSHLYNTERYRPKYTSKLGAAISSIASEWQSESLGRNVSACPANKGMHWCRPLFRSKSHALAARANACAPRVIVAIHATIIWEAAEERNSDARRFTSSASAELSNKSPRAHRHRVSELSLHVLLDMRSVPTRHLVLGKIFDGDVSPRKAKSSTYSQILGVASSSSEVNPGSGRTDVAPIPAKQDGQKVRLILPAASYLLLIQVLISPSPGYGSPAERTLPTSGWPYRRFAMGESL